MLVSISDICLLSYFNCPFSYTTSNFLWLSDHASFIRFADNALLTQKIANVSCNFVVINMFAHKRASLVIVCQN